ncbi:chromatin-remodelling complex ATPase ISWI2 [Gracilaria domingensis]|nr:chromatin-remodelling complex ATPase ISWI2 [Gracilaria domingensis]
MIVVRFHGNAEERRSQAMHLIQYGKFDAVVTSYEIVSKEKTHLNKFSWRYLIIDEAHRIKNENSLLSQVVRMFTTQARLLITGTPLQNNLHELWALLNFLLPDVFSSADVFQKWFSSVEAIESNDATTDATKQKEIVTQLHAVLRPFLIRRLKSEVEHNLPPKKETVLFTKLSEMQLNLYRNLLKKDIDAINGKGGDRVRLLNILMQLRKCVNHPYLFDGVEDRSLDPFGEHLIQNSGKLTLLDKLIPRLKEGGHRLLIFSQMTRVLDILEDYCTMRQYKFCRIDGQTDGEWRDQQIIDFNSDGSDKFIFLLSTRAGGLGINLATADTVVLYDSDWNAQCDLQAMDRAHRIGQRRPVNVYRLITENSVEERILRTAMSKLRLDTLVIQQGRLTQQKKNLQKDELLDMIRFGADKFFKSNASDYAEEDIEVILARGEEKTKDMVDEIDKKIKASGNLDLLDFKLSGNDEAKEKSIFHFEGVDYKEQTASGKEFYLDVGKRVRSKNYDEAAYFRDAIRQQTQAPEKKKPRMRYRKEPTLHDYQLYNAERLRAIYKMERDIVDKYNAESEAAINEGKEPPTLPKSNEPLLSPELEREREEHLEEGFSSWSRREYLNFLRAVEGHGRDNLEKIAEDVGAQKTLEQVAAYSKAFWEKGPSRIESWSKIQKVIQEGEQKIARREEMERALRLKVNRYENPWKELDVVYAHNRSKTFIDEEDRWLVCMTDKLGYGRWEDIKLEVRRAWQFRFNWWFKSRTPVELKRRVDVLVRLIEKENEEIQEAERLLEKRKKNTAKRRESFGNGRLNGSSTGQKKRKTEQSQVDSYFASKPKTQQLSRSS